MTSTSHRTAIMGWLSPPGDPAARRILLAGVGGILLTAPISIQLVVPVGLALGCVLTAVGAALAVCCCRWRWTPSAAVTWAAALVCLVFATATVTVGASQTATALRASDRQLLCADDVAPEVVAGGQDVLRGVNPYTSFNVARAELSLGCTSFHLTPLRGGIYAARTAAPPSADMQALARESLNATTSRDTLLGFNYPAGSALAGVTGAHGVVILNVILLLAAGALVVGRSPPGLRRWVALALAAQTGALVLVGPAHPDGIVAALLIIACAWPGPLVGGAALGLACAVKQTAWFVAPALVLLALRRGRRPGLRQLTGALGTFAVINLPFVAANPIPWLKGVLGPELAAEFPFGEGPALLFTSAGHLSLILAIFSVIGLLTVVGGWLLAGAGRGGWAAAGVIVSSLALWDGTRSLGNYIGLLGLIAVSMCVRNVLPVTASARVQRSTSRRPRLAQQAP
jgi:hypothetical protein